MANPRNQRVLTAVAWVTVGIGITLYDGVLGGIIVLLVGLLWIQVSQNKTRRSEKRQTELKVIAEIAKSEKDDPT